MLTVHSAIESLQKLLTEREMIALILITTRVRSTMGRWCFDMCLSFCLSTGGIPISIMLCNISQNSMGQTPGGVPISHNALQHFPECHGADNGGGVLISHNVLQHYPECHGQTRGGVPISHNACNITHNAMGHRPGEGGTLPGQDRGDTQVGYHPPTRVPHSQDGGVPR